MRISVPEFFRIKAAEFKQNIGTADKTQNYLFVIKQFNVNFCIPQHGRRYLSASFCLRQQPSAPLESPLTHPQCAPNAALMRLCSRQQTSVLKTEFNLQARFSARRCHRAAMQHHDLPHDGQPQA